MMDSPTPFGMEQSFSVATGEFTEAEKQYLVRKGLAWENSQGEIFDISTDVEDCNSTRSSNSSFINRSQQDSLLLFEENERLAENSSFTDEILRKPTFGSPNVSAGKLQLPIMQMNLEELIHSVSNAQEEFDEDYEDKENAVPVNQMLPVPLDLDDSESEVESVESLYFDYLESASVATAKPSENTGGQICDESELELSVVVPCTQDQGNNSYLTDNMDNSLANESCVIPSTQCDISATEIVPCTQNIPEGELSAFDISSVPCSQGSVGDSIASSGKEDLDDTITVMTKLLALADEQEENEKLASNTNLTDDQSSPLKLSGNESDIPNASGISNEQPDKPDNQDNSSAKSHGLFKTPLKHARVQMLKNKKLASPSPPRSFVNNVLQRGTLNKLTAAKGTVPNPPATGTPSMPSSTSTPKRTPLAVVTPQKRTNTPGLKTPVASKVDSGLRNLPIGLSPVADYIHSKPVPSRFVRVQGTPKQISSTNIVSKASGSVTRIPILPRVSQAQVKPGTPASASKEPRVHTVLRTSTYFSNSTPPKIVKNEPINRFQPLHYTATSKIKSVNGNVESPRPREEYVAQRHTGFRDDSGNASIIQSTLIQKRFIPHHKSRLATPPSYIRK